MTQKSLFSLCLLSFFCFACNEASVDKQRPAEKVQKKVVSDLDLLKARAASIPEAEQSENFVNLNIDEKIASIWERLNIDVDLMTSPDYDSNQIHQTLNLIDRLRNQLSKTKDKWGLLILSARSEEFSQVGTIDTYEGSYRIGIPMDAGLEEQKIYLAVDALREAEIVEQIQSRLMNPDETLLKSKIEVDVYGAIDPQIRLDGRVEEMKKFKTKIDGVIDYASSQDPATALRIIFDAQASESEQLGVGRSAVTLVLDPSALETKGILQLIERARAVASEIQTIYGDLQTLNLRTQTNEYVHRFPTIEELMGAYMTVAMAESLVTDWPQKFSLFKEVASILVWDPQVFKEAKIAYVSLDKLVINGSSLYLPRDISAEEMSEVIGEYIRNLHLIWDIHLDSEILSTRGIEVQYVGAVDPEALFFGQLELVSLVVKGFVDKGDTPKVQQVKQISFEKRNDDTFVEFKTDGSLRINILAPLTEVESKLEDLFL